MLAQEGRTGSEPESRGEITCVERAERREAGRSAALPGARFSPGSDTNAAGSVSLAMLRAEQNFFARRRARKAARLWNV